MKIHKHKQKSIKSLESIYRNSSPSLLPTQPRGQALLPASPAAQRLRQPSSWPRQPARSQAASEKPRSMNIFLKSLKVNINIMHSIKLCGNQWNIFDKLNKTHENR